LGRSANRSGQTHLKHFETEGFSLALRGASGERGFGPTEMENQTNRPPSMGHFAGAIETRLLIAEMPCGN
jgi:hypothetical protein